MFIEFKNVTFKYPDSEEYVLHNLSFSIEKGNMLTILGHNGSGKSTIAKLIMGLLQPNEGSIYIDGIELTEKTVDSLRKQMGIIFQNPDNQFVGVTVKDDIAFGLENHQVPRKEMIEQINKYASLVNMQEYLDENPENLSGGQKQRVAIAGALAMETELIIFDESTSMLDPKGTSEINHMIKTLRTKLNKTIISITHNLEEALISDRVIVVNSGKIVLDGTPQEVLKENLLAHLSNKLSDNLKNPNSFKLHHAWLNDTGRIIIVEYEGTNSYGGVVSGYVYYSFDADDNEFQIVTSFNDFDQETYSYYDSEDERLEKLLKNLAKKIAEEIIANDDLKFDDHMADRINALFKENKLKDVKLHDNIAEIYPEEDGTEA